VITPIELDSAGLRELRARLPAAVYDSGRSQVTLRVADAASERFPAILAAADAVLAAAGPRA
jgi:transcription-repair coupling factor (superfamily II helicase)